MVFEYIGNSELLREDAEPLARAAEGIYCFVVNNSGTVIVRSGDEGYTIEDSDISQYIGAEVGSVYLTDSGLIIVGTADMKAFAINLPTDKIAALTSENVIIENIIGVNGDKVYYDSGKDIYKSQILSELSVEGNLEGVDIIADDILITGHMQKAAGGMVVAGGCQ